MAPGYHSRAVPKVEELDYLRGMEATHRTDPKRTLVSALIVAVAVGLLALEAYIAFVPGQQTLLAWAGVGAGLLALLHGYQLEFLAPAVRRALVGSGALAALTMGVLGLLLL